MLSTVVARKDQADELRQEVNNINLEAICSALPGHSVAKRSAPEIKTQVVPHTHV